MAGKKDHVTLNSVEKELNAIGKALYDQARKRLDAASLGVIAVECHNRGYHLMLGRGKIPLCGIALRWKKIARPKPNTKSARDALALRVAAYTCEACRQRYYELLRKAVDIELSRI